MSIRPVHLLADAIAWKVHPMTHRDLPPVSRRNDLIAGTLLALLTVVAYLPLIKAGYIWDDGGWVVHNPLMTAPHGLWDIWFEPSKSLQYYPLVFTAFWIEHQLWGFAPLGYHLANIILQMVDALILWRILRMLRVPGAWLVAALFAIHPVQVETVAWVTEQKNLLSAFFVFFAAGAWIRFARLDDPESTAAGEWKYFFAGSLAFVLALLAKTDACTLPAVLWVITWWKRGSVRRYQGWSLVPWFAVGLAMGMVTIYIEHVKVHAAGSRFHFTVAQHLIIAARDLWFYPAKLLWPHPLLAIYHRWDIQHFSGMDLLAIIGAIAVPLTLLALSRRIGRGPFCAIAFYGLTISPVLGFASFYTETYTFVADHYQYIPCIGLFALFVGCGEFLLRKMQASAGTVSTRGQNIGGAVLAGCVVLALLPVTLKQADVYLPSIHLWTHNLKYNPQAFAAMDNVAIYDIKHHHPDEGMALLHKAWLLSDKQDPTVNTDLGDMYNHYYHEPAKVMPYCRRSLEVDPQQPTLILALVKWYEDHKDWRMAYQDLIRGVEVLPDSAAIHYQLGKFDLMARNLPAAAGQFALTTRIEPHNTKANYRMAMTLVGLGHGHKALVYFRRVVEVSPQFVPGHVSYAQCLYTLGQYAAALQQLELAEKVAPDTPVIHVALSAVLKKLGHLRQAAAQQKMAKWLAAKSKAVRKSTIPSGGPSRPVQR